MIYAPSEELRSHSYTAAGMAGGARHSTAWSIVQSQPYSMNIGRKWQKPHAFSTERNSEIAEYPPDLLILTAGGKAVGCKPGWSGAEPGGIGKIVSGAGAR